MGLLKKIEIEQVSAKIGLFGSQGSGKSLTSLLIAIGLSKTFHNGAPIGMHDTEGASDFLKPILDIEGIDLLRHKSTSFKDMVTVLKEAENGGCCVYIQDTVSRTWTELVEAIQKKKQVKKLEFQHWNEVKGIWRSYFVDRYMTSPLHCIVVGRAGDEYDTVEDEKGKRSQERVGSRMAAEKGFGYEPNLLIEMEGRRALNVETEGKKKRVRKQGGKITHYAHVLKDRSRALNGLSIPFKDLNDYKKGDWQPVFKAFAPHWAFLNIGQTAAGTVDVRSSSADMFEDDPGQNRVNWGRRRDIAIEEINGLLDRDLFPGSTAVVRERKGRVYHELFDTHSEKAVEGMSVDRLEEAVGVLKAMRSALQANGMPESLDGVLKALREARAFYGEMRAGEMARETEQAERAASIRAEDEALARDGQLAL
jgi:hypothetical protein